jgi:hypothetical protein
MNHDAILSASMLLSACVTGTCTVLASLATVRAARKARVRAEKERSQSISPDQGPGPTVRARFQLWKHVLLSVSVTVFLIVTLIVQVVSLSHLSSDQARSEHSPISTPRILSDSEWRERPQSPEWLAWRKQTHEKLSAEPVSEKRLAEILASPDLPRTIDQDDQPAILRRDQSIAEVLLSYDEIRKILEDRIGIRKELFLGTGFSKPVKERRYSSATVHEYLIPNLPETDSRVWTWQLKPDPESFKMPIKRIVAGLSDDSSGETTPIPPTNVANGETSKSLKPILDHVSPNKRPEYKDVPAVIRFGQFPLKAYKGTLGRPETPGHPRALRAFASNLAEVWDLPLQSAARLSGYLPTPGDDNTFFIWIFVPSDEGQVVPATWGRVLKELPTWLKETESKSP